MIDEAHKFMDGVSTDGLSNAIVDIARLMRHDGIRLVVSTQSPKALAPELLELSSVAVMHQFTSREWFDHMAHKLPLSPAAFDKIMSLRQGQALVFAKRHSINSAADCLTSSSSAESASITGGESKLSADNSIVSDFDGKKFGSNVFPISIRPRITCDLGASKTNHI